MPTESSLPERCFGDSPIRGVSTDRKGSPVEEILTEKACKEVFAFLYSRLGNAEDAADVAQEVYARAARTILATGPPRHPRAWLYRIAKNEMFGWRRKKHREDRGRAALYAAADIEKPPNLQWRLEIEQALSELEEAMREAVIYIHMLGYTYREAADLAHVPVTTMMSRAYRGRTKLRELLGDKLDPEART
jgi:RNA polymerase sigma-70 factor (ECF subfamily)